MNKKQNIEDFVKKAQAQLQQVEQGFSLLQQSGISHTVLGFSCDGLDAAKERALQKASYQLNFEFMHTQNTTRLPWCIDQINKLIHAPISVENMQDMINLANGQYDRHAMLGSILETAQIQCFSEKLKMDAQNDPGKKLQYENTALNLIWVLIDHLVDEAERPDLRANVCNTIWGAAAGQCKYFTSIGVEIEKSRKGSLILYFSQQARDLLNALAERQTCEVSE